MKQDELTLEEINTCYDKAHERWERDSKTGVYEFNFLWQYIADEVVKAQLAKSHKLGVPELGAIKKILRLPISIDVQTVTDRVDKWDTYTGQMQEGFVTEMAKRLLALIPNKDVVTSEMLTAIVKGAKCEERERILNQMALERCDPDVMAYFEDYYYLPKSIWQALKEEKVNG